MMAGAKPWILLSARRDQKEGLKRKRRSKDDYYIVNMSKLTREREREREIQYFLACKLPGKLSMPALYWATWPSFYVHADLHCYTNPSPTSW
jgi:hypothetical protein